MPLLESPDFGSFDYAAEDVITFPEGLPSFESLHRFLVLQIERFAPFVFLVSVDQPSTRFTCAPVTLIEPNYRLELTGDEGQVLGLPPGVYPGPGSDPFVFAVLTLPEDGAPTANLLSPVVIDPRRHLGAQLILAGHAYSHIAPVFRQPAEAAAC